MPIHSRQLYIKTFYFLMNQFRLDINKKFFPVRVVRCNIQLFPYLGVKGLAVMPLFASYRYKVVGTVEIVCFYVFMFLAIFSMCYFCTKEYCIALLSSGFTHLTVARRRL